jgi:hypothetical protein
VGAKAGAASQVQLPRTPLPPANQSSLRSTLYGRLGGSVAAWDDGATWDGEAPILTLPCISMGFFPGGGV